MPYIGHLILGKFERLLVDVWYSPLSRPKLEIFTIEFHESLLRIMTSFQSCPQPFDKASSWLAEPSSGCPTLCRPVPLRWGPVVSGVMHPCVIRKFNIGLERRIGFRHTLKVTEGHLFLLPRSPEPLDENVVEHPATTLHANWEVLRQH